MKNTCYCSKRLSLGATLLLCLLGLSSGSNAVKLEGYNVDLGKVTVSGFSSGGAMAMQFHIAFSKDIYGAGILSGIPYACGKEYGDRQCRGSPDTVDVNALMDEVPALVAEGKIDSTFNLKNVPVFIFQGTKDSSVLPGNGKIIKEMYTNFGSNIQSVFNIAAEHGYPTNFYGATCGSSAALTQFITNCNYQAAYRVLQHLYPGEIRRKPRSAAVSAKKLAGDFLVFEQSEFVDARSPIDVSMGPEGFLYVPSQCRSKTVACKFHIVFHGCTQSKTSIGDIFANKTGYLEVAELNNIILLFPQAAPNSAIGNDFGCWDWVGYRNAKFLTKDGDQMKAVYKMLNRVVEQPRFPAYKPFQTHQWRKNNNNYYFYNHAGTNHN